MLVHPPRGIDRLGLVTPYMLFQCFCIVSGDLVVLLLTTTVLITTTIAIIIIIIIIIPGFQNNIYGPDIMTQSHCMSLHGSHYERRMAADLWTKPTDLSHRAACRQL